MEKEMLKDSQKCFEKKKQAELNLMNIKEYHKVPIQGECLAWE